MSRMASKTLLVIRQAWFMIVRQSTWYPSKELELAATTSRSALEDTTTNQDPADVSTEPVSWALGVLDTQLFSCLVLPSRAKGLWIVLKQWSIVMSLQSQQVRTCPHHNTVGKSCDCEHKKLRPNCAWPLSSKPSGKSHGSITQSACLRNPGVCCVQWKSNNCVHMSSRSSVLFFDMRICRCSGVSLPFTAEGLWQFLKL